MARPAKYFTKEEKEDAARLRRMKSYYKNHQRELDRMADYRAQRKKETP